MDTPTESFHISEHLRRLRTERGLSIRALAREVDITHYTIAAYERQKIVPSLENGFKLAEFFDVPIEYLVKGKLVNTDFGDAQLLELFRVLDAMSAEDRKVAKQYLSKLIRNRKEWEDIRNEAQS